MNAASVEKPSASECILINTRERSPVSVMNVGKPSARVLTLTSPGESTAVRSYVTINVRKLPSEVHPLVAHNSWGAGGGRGMNSRMWKKFQFLLSIYYQIIPGGKESFQVSFYCREIKFVAEVSSLKHSQEIL